MLALLPCMDAGAAQPDSVPNGKAAAFLGKPVDLRAPDITRLVSAEELARLAKGTVEEEIELDEVKVEGPSELPPVKPVWPGLLAPFWALAHPTQAWRIFTPVPADQVNSRMK